MVYIKFLRFILNFFDLFHQRKVLALFKKKFTNPITIIDVGAHFGETIITFKKNFNIKKIYSFEASPINFEILKKKFSNNLKNIEIHNFGIGAHISEDVINQTAESSSSTINTINKNSKYFKRKLKILKIKDQNLFIKKIPIKIITLDDFIEKNKIDIIDILKIDTEGYELNVLKGLKKNYNKIKIIYFEHHYDDMIEKNYKFSDINKILDDYGFIQKHKSKMFFRKSFEYIYENKFI
tara:strand:- start:821 stop:1534 length:714 start_codon:yes stop_codon:yes gene_type:complete